MPDPSNNNNSFIPKKGPSTTSRRSSASQKIYLFTVISYVLIFSTLIASGGVFLYTKYLTNQRTLEHNLLYKDISVFNEENMKEVVDYNRRLEQASKRFNHRISLVNVLQAFESSTVQSIMVDTLEITREMDEKVILLASINTDSFDSTIFQRKIYSSGAVINSITIDEFDASGLGIGEREVNTINRNTNSNPEADKLPVVFKAELTIPLSNIPPKQNSFQTPNPLLNISGNEALDSDFQIEEDNFIINQ